MPIAQNHHLSILSYRGVQAVLKTRFGNPPLNKGYIKHMLIGIKLVFPKSKLCNRCIWNRQKWPKLPNFWDRNVCDFFNYQNELMKHQVFKIWSFRVFLGSVLLLIEFLVDLSKMLARKKLGSRIPQKFRLKVLKFRCIIFFAY